MYLSHNCDKQIITSELDLKINVSIYFLVFLQTSFFKLSFLINPQLSLTQNNFIVRFTTLSLDFSFISFQVILQTSNSNNFITIDSHLIPFQAYGNAKTGWHWWHRPRVDVIGSIGRQIETSLLNHLQTFCATLKRR